MDKLYELAKVFRSKNAGPFELTIDILFDNKEIYYRVKKSDVINSDSVARAYNIDKKNIRYIIFFDKALGIKITMFRTVSSGSAGDRDVYGSQQHTPLMNLKIDRSY